MPEISFQRGIYSLEQFMETAFQEINVGINIYLLSPNLHTKTCAEIIIFPFKLYLFRDLWGMKKRAEIYIIDTLCSCVQRNTINVSHPGVLDLSLHGDSGEYF